MFDVNKAIMRCLVKNLAMFGLGLYVYAGEDLPEDAAPQSDAEPKKQPKPKSTNQKQEKPPMPCICVRCNQPIKRVKLKDGSIMQAAEFANGNDFDTAWLNAMYTDVYEYSGKYSNLDAWARFTKYIAFYDEVVDYNNALAPAPGLYDVYYAYDPKTEEEAGQCVDEVIQIAEESGAETQFY